MLQATLIMSFIMKVNISHETGYVLILTIITLGLNYAKSFSLLWINMISDLTHIISKIKKSRKFKPTRISSTFTGIEDNFVSLVWYALWYSKDFSTSSYSNRTTLYLDCLCLVIYVSLRTFPKFAKKINSLAKRAKFLFLKNSGKSYEFSRIIIVRVVYFFLFETLHMNLYCLISFVCIYFLGPQ